MNRIILALVLALPTALFGQGLFEGTWRTNMEKASLSPKPFTFAVDKGMYSCSTCRPPVTIKADGTDQLVAGHPYDVQSVTVLDAYALQMTTKKNGKVASRQTRTVSKDGKTLVTQLVNYPHLSEQPVNLELTYTRIAEGSAGSHAASGSWRLVHIKEDENGRITVYKSTPDGLRMSTPTGISFVAKFDGNSYPVKGSHNFDAISLLQIDDHTLEEKFTRQGILVETDKITVAADGRTMTIISTNELTTRTSTYIDEKQ